MSKDLEIVLVLWLVIAGFFGVFVMAFVSFVMLGKSQADELRRKHLLIFGGIALLFPLSTLCVAFVYGLVHTLVAIDKRIDNFYDNKLPSGIRGWLEAKVGKNDSL